MAVHTTGEPTIRKVKAGWTLQASKVEASLQLKCGPKEGRKQVRNNLAAEVEAASEHKEWKKALA